MIQKKRINPVEVAASRVHDKNRLCGIPLPSRAILRTGAGLLRVCLALPLAGFFATPAWAQTEIWSATLTIGDPGGPEGFCSAVCGADEHFNYGSLSVATFELNGTIYTVHSLRYGAANRRNFRFEISPRPADAEIADFQLQTGSSSYDFSDAVVILDMVGDDGTTLLKRIEWDLADDDSERPWPDPTPGSTIAVRLVGTVDAADQPEFTDMPQQEAGEHDPAGVQAGIFPEISGMLADLSGRALSDRIGTAGSGSPNTVSLGGSAGLADALLSRASSLRSGTFDAAGFLSGSSFSLVPGERGSSSFWGTGSYRDLSDDAGPVRWDGEIMGGHLGVDTHLYPEVLAGLMVSVYEGDLDYVERTDAGDARGAYSIRMTSLNPYAAWRLASGVRLWGTFGIGDGTVLLEGSGAAHRSAMNQRSLTLGFRGPEQDLGGGLPGGGTTLTVKGDGTVSHGETAGTEGLEGLSVSTRRLRLLAEGRHERVLAGGAQAHATLELGFRQDSGDGGTGTGVELGGGAGYVNRSGGLSLAGRVRTRLSDGSQVDEWGLSGSLAVDARPGSELGFSLSLEPAWRVAKHGAASALWSGDRSGPAGAGSAPGGRLDMDLGYGFAVLSGRYAGIPHAGVALQTSGRAFHLGYRLRKLQGGTVEVGLAGRRHERDGNREPVHVIELGGRLDW